MSDTPDTTAAPLWPGAALAVVGNGIATGISEGLRDLGVPNTDWSMPRSGLWRADPCDWRARIMEVADSAPRFGVIAIGLHDCERVSGGTTRPDPTGTSAGTASAGSLHAAEVAFLVLAVPDTEGVDVSTVNMLLLACAKRIGGDWLRLAEHSPDCRSGDGIHFTGAGNRLMAHQIADAMPRFFSRRGL